MRLAAVLALVLSAACVTQPSATIRSGYQRTETGEDFSESLTNLIEVAAQGNLGPELAFRASERLILTELEQESAGVTSSDSRVLNQPSVDLTYDNGVFKWTQGLELQQFESQPTGSPKNKLNQTDILEKVEWSPLGLPKFTAWLDARTSKDDLFTDLTDRETVFQIEDTRGPFSLLYAFENQDSKDNESGVDRQRDQNLFRGTYADAFIDDKLSVNVSVFSDSSKTTTNTPSGGGVLPPTEVFPNKGLTLLDPSPSISILADTPALIDFDDLTSTGINIGGFVSGGMTNWNLGVDLPLGSTIDLLVLSTHVEVDSFLVNQYSFSVWVSDDNNFWTLVTGSAAYTYDDIARRFLITIPAVTKEFVKVINTASPPGAPAIFVTELRAFAPDPGGGGGGATTAEVINRSITSNLTYRANDDLTLGYDLLVSEVVNEVNGMKTRDETRIDHGASALWRPTDIVDVNLRASVSDTDDPSQSDETFDSLNAVVNVRPLDTVDIAFSHTSTDRTIDGLDTLATESYQARMATQLLETLHGEILFESNTQEDTTNMRTIDRTVVGANLIASVTSAWNVTMGVRNEEATVTGPGAAGIPDPSETIAQVLVVYRPSDQVTAEADLEWRDTFSGAGLDQRYRIDWIPFPDGTLDIQLDMQMQQDDVFGTGANRYLVLTRWTMNPKTFIEVNYAIQEPQDDETTTSIAIAVNVYL